MTPRWTSSAELRRKFVKFFAADHSHSIVKGSSLVPSRDPSLLFTNAGMVQFKDNFLGNAPPPEGNPRAVSVQRCVRAGGKHNDLENVGLTPRHHTFFEMLGNFSFGDYFKEEAIVMAWEFLTDRDYLDLPTERLRISVHKDDQETHNLWKKISGLDDDQIVRLGDEDNFWSMGDVGPCGPCTEIFWDQGDHVKDEESRWLEIWNLVFMQFERSKDFEGIRPIPRPSVDTGMGLERMASVMQGASSNYGSDELMGIMNAAASLASERARRKMERLDVPAPPTNSDECALRVISDHLRASMHLIADGVIPSNIGRGYVLRRILRRALRYGNTIGIRGPFLGDLTKTVATHCDPNNTGVLQSIDAIENIIRNEEEIFSSTLDRGLILLNQELLEITERAETKQLPGATVFKLYDTYGFPPDLTELVVRENGWSADMEAFENMMEQQRARAREAWQGSEGIEVPPTVLSWKPSRPENSSVCYGRENLEMVTCIENVHWLSSQGNKNGGVQVWVSLESCPFYPQGGGQRCDEGTVTILSGGLDEIVFTVLNAIKTKDNGGQTALLLDYTPADGRGQMVIEDRLLETLFAPGTAVSVEVDRRVRDLTSVHHTATHLVHEALRQILGVHVVQAGSAVDESRLRFDFTHANPLSENQIEDIEDWVNAAVSMDYQVAINELPFAEAKRTGALAHFGEKYGDTVRVVDIGDGVSTELCGGTHSASTSSLRPFKITSEGSASAGVRRIEAISGDAAVLWYKAQYENLRNLARTLRIAENNSGLPSCDHVANKVLKLQEENKQLKMQVSEMHRSIMGPRSSNRGASGGQREGAVPPKTKFNLVAQNVLGDSNEFGFTVSLNYLQIPLSIMPENAATKKGKKHRQQESVKAIRDMAMELKDSRTADAILVLDGFRVAVVWSDGSVGSNSKKYAKTFLNTIFATFNGRGGGSDDLAQGQFVQLVSEKMIENALFEMEASKNFAFKKRG
jgi:alanyl-tRNA synthetase